MQTTIQIPTAKQINDAHRLARTCAETAIGHAIRCGKLLTEKKVTLARGDFDGWVESSCEFGRATAYNYMRASKSSNALDGSAIRHLFPSGQPGAKPHQPKTPADASGSSQPERTIEPAPTIEPVAAGESAETTAAADDKAADTAFDPNAAWEPSEDETRNLEILQKEYDAAIEKVMGADDKLATAHSEIKRLTASIARITQARDGYQNRASEVIRRYKASQRENDRLKRDNDGLKRRISELEKAEF